MTYPVMSERVPTDFLACHPSSILVEIVGTKGSAPRASGTFMLVAENAIWGTIGGGQLEFMAINNARALLGGEGMSIMDVPLGPQIGQCCGGHATLSFTVMSPELGSLVEERVTREMAKSPAVFLYGAGHVGLALARALVPLPLSVTVIETRGEPLAMLPAGVATRHAAMPEATIADIPSGGAAVVLTHDHALDFLITREALMRPDLRYVGMIGSLTKRATFANWLRREGGAPDLVDRLVLPIGGNIVKDSRPAVIAAMVAVELLTIFNCNNAINDTITDRTDDT